MNTATEIGKRINGIGVDRAYKNRVRKLDVIVVRPIDRELSEISFIAGDGQRIAGEIHYRKAPTFIKHRPMISGPRPRARRGCGHRKAWVRAAIAATVSI